VDLKFDTELSGLGPETSGTERTQMVISDKVNAFPHSDKLKLHKTDIQSKTPKKREEKNSLSLMGGPVIPNNVIVLADDILLGENTGTTF